MKRILSAIAVLAALVLAADTGWGASFRPLPEQEQAYIGATHVATIGYADLTDTNVNTAQTLTNVFAVEAKQGVQLVAMQLITAFNAGNNATGSVAVIVGDGTDTDLYLTSTELNSNLTEVWLKYGRSVQAATSGVITNVIGATTNLVTVLTALTDDVTGRKLYTASDTIDFTFTPNAVNSLSQNTAGEVRFYFKVIR